MKTKEKNMVDLFPVYFLYQLYKTPSPYQMKIGSLETLYIIYYLTAAIRVFLT